MGHDIVVFDEQYRYAKELHVDHEVHGLLFRKLVTVAEYPMLGRLKEDEEDVIFPQDEIAGLKADLDRLEKYLKGEKLMAPAKKEKCLHFVEVFKDICDEAMRTGRTVDCVAGE